ncbi:MAG: hypothetical protein ACJAV1_003917 [Paraglaciecola sp.]|jgi:hypothetical protein
MYCGIQIFLESEASQLQPLFTNKVRSFRNIVGKANLLE